MRITISRCIAAIVILMATLSIALLYRNKSESVTMAEGSHTRSPVGESASPIIENTPKTARVSKSGTDQNVYRSQLQHATNYREFANSVIGAATEGDPDAQFYLSQALKTCDDGYRAYFDRGKHRRTIDEALRWASTRQGAVRMEEVQSIYDKCHDLKEQEAAFGSALGWLAKATENGQPVAQATTAIMLMNESALGFFRGAESPSIAHAESTLSPSELLVNAIKSKNPEALWLVGTAKGALQHDMHDQLAWWVVACERGYDCSASSEWYVQMCALDRNCQPGNSGIEYLRQNAQLLNYYDFDEKVQEINADIESGNWEKLASSSR